jgi:hypothetical protein
MGDAHPDNYVEFIYDRLLIYAKLIGLAMLSERIAPSEERCRSFVN